MTFDRHQAGPSRRPILSIGRSSDNDIYLDGDTVSARHAHLELYNGEYVLVDLRSKNGTFLNDQEISRQAIQTGDCVRIGPHVLVFDGQTLVHQTEGRAVECDFVPLGDAPLQIGRADDNDLVLDDDTVSAHHAVIRARADGHEIEDRGSTNGTRINGRKITREHLVAGAVIRFGDFTLTYDGRGLTSDRRFGPSGQQSRAATEEIELELDRDETTIGRDPGCDLVLDHPTVSRRHARIGIRGRDRVISDLGSHNGTFVNGRMVREQVLQPGDRIRIGGHTIVYSGSYLTTKRHGGTGMRLDVRNLSKVVHQRTKGFQQAVTALFDQLSGNSAGKVRLLQDLSFSILPNEFVAIVGGSGAGKSTLLKALNGFSPGSGLVQVNGADLYRRFDEFRPVLGYVPQADIIHDSLPVDRALDYVTRLRLPDATPIFRRQQVERVLEMVDMKPHRANLIRELSGGQRKRISTAVELLADPKILFLDEPTSGLDPGLDKRMMKNLRKLADGGRTVVLVTHATGNIEVCDHIIFLGTGGRLCYFGPPREALAYFGETDFAEIYTKVEGDPVGYEARFIRGSEPYRRYVAKRLGGDRTVAGWVGSASGARTRVADMPYQLWVLTSRYIEVIQRDWGHALILLLQAPLIAGILYMVAGEDVFKGGSPSDGFKSQSIVFIMACVAVWFGVINAAREITKELPIYRRERMANLGIAPYLLSKMGVLTVLVMVQSAILLFIVTLKTGLPEHGIVWTPRVDMFVTLVITSIAALATGLLVSALVPNEDRAMSIVPIILIPQIILAGVTFELLGAAEWLSKATLSYWSTHALGSIVDICGLIPDLPDGTTCGGERVHLAYEATRPAILTDWAVLAGIAALFLLLTMAALKRKDRRT